MNQDETCTNTRQSFCDKWEQNPSLMFSETRDPDSDVHQWILRRNGFGSDADLRDYLKDKRRILDAGCGNGRVTAMLRDLSDDQMTMVVGIDLVSSAIASNNLHSCRNVSFTARDLLSDLSDLGEFDFIYCQEVLHHTKDPVGAFSNLAERLTPGGEIAIYVYKKKAPAREFLDDFIRGEISCLSYEDSLAVCQQLTALGKALHDCGVTVRVPRVDVLQIEEGEYDVQRFIYHFFLKCFWNDGLSFHDNAVINYDWYHPQTCTRHTLPEVRSWFESCGLSIVHEHVDPYGITVRGQRTSQL